MKEKDALMAVSSSLGPLVLLLGGKAARAAFLFWAFDLLHTQALPVPLLAFVLVAGCAVLLLVAIRPWDAPSLRRFPLLLAHSLLLATNVLCFHFGLKHYGPLK